MAKILFPTDCFNVTLSVFTVDNIAGKPTETFPRCAFLTKRVDKHEPSNYHESMIKSRSTALYILFFAFIMTLAGVGGVVSSLTAGEETTTVGHIVSVTAYGKVWDTEGDIADAGRCGSGFICGADVVVSFDGKNTRVTDLAGNPVTTVSVHVAEGKFTVGAPITLRHSPDFPYATIVTAEDYDKKINLPVAALMVIAGFVAFALFGAWHGPSWVIHNHP